MSWGDLKFDEDGRLIKPEFPDEEAEVKKKAVHFGEKYSDEELLEILETDNWFEDVKEIALKYGRTMGGIRWILDHRNYYRKWGKIKTSNNLETDKFIQQIKKLIDENNIK